MGQSPPGRTYNDRGEGMPFVQGAAEFGQQHPEPIKWCTEPRKVAAPGDLLVSVRAPVGALSIAAQRLAIGRGLAIVRGLDGIALTAFLRLALEAGVAELRSRAGGGMFESITRAGLSGLSLDKPPLAEQRRIIDLVGAADDVMARAGSELESLIDARRAMLRSLLAAREGWARTTLGEIAVEVRDRVANPARSGLDRYVGLEHFESDVPLPRHGHPSEVTSQKSVFRVDDVLFGTLRPYLRKVALAPWPGICSTDVLVDRSRPDQVLPQFLY